MLVLHPSSCCDVCLEPYSYDSPSLAPHAIPCGHTFCYTCLMSVHPPTCPLCRKSFLPDRLKKLHVDRPESLDEFKELLFLQRLALTWDAPDQELVALFDEIRIFLDARGDDQHQPLRKTLKTHQRYQLLKSRRMDDHKMIKRLQRDLNNAEDSQAELQANERNLNSEVRQLKANVESLQVEAMRLRTEANARRDNPGLRELNLKVAQYKTELGKLRPLLSKIPRYESELERLRFELERHANTESSLHSNPLPAPPQMRIYAGLPSIAEVASSNDASQQHAAAQTSSFHAAQIATFPQSALATPFNSSTHPYTESIPASGHHQSDSSYRPISTHEQTSPDMMHISRIGKGKEREPGPSYDLSSHSVKHTQLSPSSQPVPTRYPHIIVPGVSRDSRVIPPNDSPIIRPAWPPKPPATPPEQQTYDHVSEMLAAWTTEYGEGYKSGYQLAEYTAGTEAEVVSLVGGHSDQEEDEYDDGEFHGQGATGERLRESVHEVDGSSIRGIRHGRTGDSDLLIPLGATAVPQPAQPQLPLVNDNQRQPVSNEMPSTRMSLSALSLDIGASRLDTDGRNRRVASVTFREPEPQSSPQLQKQSHVERPQTQHTTAMTNDSITLSSFNTLATGFTGLDSISTGLGRSVRRAHRRNTSDIPPRPSQLVDMNSLPQHHTIREYDPATGFPLIFNNNRNSSANVNVVHQDMNAILGLRNPTGANNSGRQPADATSEHTRRTRLTGNTASSWGTLFSTGPPVLDWQSTGGGSFSDLHLRTFSSNVASRAAASTGLSAVFGQGISSGAASIRDGNESGESTVGRAGQLEGGMTNQIPNTANLAQNASSNDGSTATAGTHHSQQGLYRRESIGQTTGDDARYTRRSLDNSFPLQEADEEGMLSSRFASTFSLRSRPPTAAATSEFGVRPPREPGWQNDRERNEDWHRDRDHDRGAERRIMTRSLSSLSSIPMDSSRRTQPDVDSGHQLPDQPYAVPGQTVYTGSQSLSQRSSQSLHSRNQEMSNPHVGRIRRSSTLSIATISSAGRSSTLNSQAAIPTTAPADTVLWSGTSGRHRQDRSSTNSRSNSVSRPPSASNALGLDGLNEPQPAQIPAPVPVVSAQNFIRTFSYEPTPE